MEELSQKTVSINKVDKEVTNEGGGIFSFEPGLAVWTWVVFALLFFVLSKYAWRPMLEAVRRREQLLKDAVENARKTKEELEKISIRQGEMIKSAEENARKIMEEARSKAEQASKNIIEKAKIEAEDKLNQVVTQIERERNEALSEIKSKAADLATALSEKILKEKLSSEEKQREFIEKEIKNL
ncbi:MAG TPA: F0F1 ATP synthase subunit B [Victivallales bacterium]|nr:F0F1 ATP synthase subunit B [Victivallales bacterium]HPO89903.1 F0F1 ATP synthase subunit B [Victivallales bacterium]HRR06225.1 F0F1 ATP synthase subunit B [Victivallales bacterium]HRR28895.1 F0F1 ATP synthase subunit B [Victivallales bacterium]HRU01939.1 F0F1 ATP synthase subunit B [Victivallales bacterium]